MIAEIYPLKRLPRRFNVFDYQISEGLEVRRGSFVRIPFRASVIWGVVARLQQTPSDRKLKAIESVAEGLVLSDAELSYYEALATDLVQAVSTILHVSIPTLPQKFSTHDTQPSAHKQSSHVTGFIVTPHLQACANLIHSFHEKHPGATLVVAPNVRDAHLLASHLHASVITGEEPQARRRETWIIWRTKQAVLVTTRIGILLPHANLANIFVVRSGHANHKQSDRNPRFDARKAALLRSKRQSARLYFLDVLPRADEGVESQSVSMPATHWPSTIVDMNKERPAGVHPLLSPTFMQEAEHTLASGKRILCVYNRKGVSRRMRCKDCGHVFACPTCLLPLSVHEANLQCHRCGHSEPFPLACPTCQGSDLLQRGFGNKTIAVALQKQFPQNSVAIVEEGSDNSDVEILLVTKYYLERIFDPFQPPNIGLVAELDADMALYQPHFRASEQAILSASEWRGVAQASRATFLLQTETPDLFSRGLNDPLAFMRDEQKTRTAYDLPPTKRIMTITRRTDGEATVERMVAEKPPATFHDLPDSDIIDTWAES